LTRKAPPRTARVAELVRIVTASSCFDSLPPTKRNRPRVVVIASLPLPVRGS
jgi:hypothetical protein